MCYHTKQTKVAKEIENRFKAKFATISLFQPQQSINGFDFPSIPIIIDQTPEIITHFNWGLIPTWAKEPAIQKHNLNARVETVSEKPSFKNSVNKRCLVIANGYFEWEWLDPKGKIKQKYEIGLPNEELFAFAGLYSHWVNKDTGEIKNTFTIVTTEANPFLAEIHNTKKRMPIILKKDDEARWLQKEPILNFAYPYSIDLIAKKIA
nr:SOS response-associated peptidase [uncultured Flavobacterium sp.]